VPLAVRQRAADVLGAPIARAVRAWGGYAPSATFRLRLADGRLAFFKGVYADSNDHMRSALVTEERVYRGLGETIAPWSPSFLGAFRVDDWHVLLLEDLGPRSAPPWTDGRLRAVAHGLADLHLHHLGRELPDWLPRDKHTQFAAAWDKLLAEDGVNRLVEIAGPAALEVESWFAACLPVLRASSRRLATAPPPSTLIHFDVRSDNLRIVGGRLRLFDWNWASVGPAEIDLAAFAQSVAVEGGPDPERVVSLYSEVLPLREDVLTDSAAAIAAYFLNRFCRPDVPFLPRMRTFQRQQAGVTLPWASRRLSLPAPEWLGRLVARLG
jgi:hypothetical protein